MTVLSFERKKDNSVVVAEVRSVLVNYDVRDPVVSIWGNYVTMLSMVVNPVSDWRLFLWNYRDGTQCILDTALAYGPTVSPEVSVMWCPDHLSYAIH